MEPYDYASGVRFAVVHHTVNANDYGAEPSPPCCARSRRSTGDPGWNDIGYNFIVDRFGRTWEAGRGRRPTVIGGHAWVQHRLLASRCWVHFDVAVPSAAWSTSCTRCSAGSSPSTAGSARIRHRDIGRVAEVPGRYPGHHPDGGRPPRPRHHVVPRRPPVRPPGHDPLDRGCRLSQRGRDHRLRWPRSRRHQRAGVGLRPVDDGTHRRARLRQRAVRRLRERQRLPPRPRRPVPRRRRQPRVLPVHPCCRGRPASRVRVRHQRRQRGELPARLPRRWG